MAVKIYYQEDCNMGLLEGKTIAIIGHAHAQILKDSGCDVIVGLYEGSRSWEKAEKQGFKVYTAAEAAKKADIIMILINDEKQAKLYKESIEPNLEEQYVDVRAWLFHSFWTDQTSEECGCHNDRAKSTRPYSEKRVSDWKRNPLSGCC